MTLETPVWQDFDPATDDVPASISALLDGDGPVRVLALAVAPTAEDGPWAPGVSAKVAEAAAERGARTILIDLCLEGSSLPAELGITPGEGISDVFEFGASARRVSRGVREGAFLFVPAGTVVGDSSKILEHPRWETVLAGYRKSGTLVLLHVPLSLEGAANLLERADAVVLLTGAAAPSETLVESSAPVHAVISPRDVAEGVTAGPAGEPGADADHRSDGAHLAAADVASLEVHLAESLETPDQRGAPSLTEGLDAGTAPAEGEGAAFPEVAFAGALPTDQQEEPVERMEAELDPFWDEAATEELRGDAAEAPSETEAAASDGPHAPSLTDFEGLPSGEPSSGPRARRRRLLLLALIVIVVAALIGLMRRDRAPAVSDAPADEGLVEVSAARSADAELAAATQEPGDAAGGGDLASAAGSASTVPGEDAMEEAAPPTAGVSSPSEVMRFGLTINAHERVTAAQEQARDLQARFPSLQFVLVPVQVRGTTYHRVVAGPAESVDGVEAVRAELAGYIGSAVASGAIVRSTRVAFLLGEYDSLDEAMARRGQAEDVGIPAYFAEYGPAEGPLRYRVYAGAYANAREASHLQTLLIESGLTGAILTERVGRPLR